MSDYIDIRGRYYRFEKIVFYDIITVEGAINTLYNKILYFR
jgi:hypothetical protein